MLEREQTLLSTFIKEVIFVTLPKRGWKHSAYAVSETTGSNPFTHDSISEERRKSLLLRT